MRSPVSFGISSAVASLRGKRQGRTQYVDILKSPQVKAVLAGIAATVVKRVTQGSSRTA